MRDLRVLIADASPSVRAVIRRIVTDVDSLGVAAEARTGDEALALTSTLRPDAVVMDADLTLADGGPAAEEILFRHQVPVILLATGQDRTRMVATFRTLSKGAVAVLAKPTVPHQWRVMAETLAHTLEHIGRTRGGESEPDDALADSRGRLVRRVAVGASAGGPRALAEMLGQLGMGFPAAVAVVQHIAPGFEGALVQWLAGESGLDVALACDGEAFAPGRVRLAQAGCHLTVDDQSRLRLDCDTAPHDGHRPSIDVLFRSLARSDATSTAAILLSGMGADGALGLSELKAAGAVTIAQDEATSALWGMPRIAMETGAAELVMSPKAIGRFLRKAACGEGQ